MVRTDATADDSFAAILARSRLGMAMAAMMRIMATTINSSIREKPLSLGFVTRLFRVIDFANMGKLRSRICLQPRRGRTKPVGVSFLELTHIELRHIEHSLLLTTHRSLLMAHYSAFAVLRLTIHALDHVNFGAVLVELHFVHQLVDQKNSAAVIGKKILAHGAGGNRAGIESWPGIAHNNQDA